jgi:hypothetical protein
LTVVYIKQAYEPYNYIHNKGTECGNVQQLLLKSPKKKLNTVLPFVKSGIFNECSL